MENSSRRALLGEFASPTICVRASQKRPKDISPVSGHAPAGRFVWRRIKRGEIEAIHVRNGRKKGLRLKHRHRNSSNRLPGRENGWDKLSEAYEVRPRARPIAIRENKIAENHPVWSKY
jgi:hypothetical protein